MADRGQCGGWLDCVGVKACPIWLRLWYSWSVRTREYLVFPCLSLCSAPRRLCFHIPWHWWHPLLASERTLEQIQEREGGFDVNAGNVSSKYVELHRRYLVLVLWFSERAWVTVAYWLSTCNLSWASGNWLIWGYSTNRDWGSSIGTKKLSQALSACQLVLWRIWSCNWR